jgi:hypothetical protein
MKQHLVELTFLLYGLYLLSQYQYLTLLILLILSLILILKGVRHKESLIITIVFLIFITEYHKYFPFREKNNNNIQNENIINENIENFRSNIEDKKLKADKADRKRKRKERKKIKDRLQIEMKKSDSGLPIQYIKNKLKINDSADSWGSSLSKWYLFKENFFILLNKD